MHVAGATIANSAGMTQSTEALAAYQAPVRPLNHEGNKRRVGLELELANLSLETALDIVSKTVGGKTCRASRTEGSVEDTPFGTFKIELDSKPLKERRYLEPLARMGVELDTETAQQIEDVVLEVAEDFVPLEIVTPPIAWDDLQRLDPLWVALRAAGAADTKSSVFYAFGLHLNPEPPDFETETLLSFIRSFLVLEDFLIKDAGTDLTRRIAPYIRGFPEEYRRKVLGASYQPDFEGLVQDYVAHNPTRNRPLDLLPLFSHLYAHRKLDVAPLASAIEDWELVGSRPTFHYRLPNSEIAQQSWSPALDWNRWLIVEKLAANAPLLLELSEAYLSTSDLPLRLQRGGWADAVRDRLGAAYPEGLSAAMAP